MSKSAVFAASILLFLTGTTVTAQVPDGGGPPDPAQMRQRFADRMKEALGVSDDEWKALQPRIEKVQQLRRDASGRGFGPGGAGGPPPGFGGGPGGPQGQGGPGGPPPGAFGGPGGPQRDQSPSPVQQKVNELRETLDNKDAKPDEIKAKLVALRDARAKARADLAKAQDELRDLLTVRQESVMVMMGMLE